MEGVCGVFEPGAGGAGRAGVLRTSAVCPTTCSLLCDESLLMGWGGGGRRLDVSLDGSLFGGVDDAGSRDSCGWGGLEGGVALGGGGRGGSFCSGDFDLLSMLSKSTDLLFSRSAADLTYPPGIRRGGVVLASIDDPRGRGGLFTCSCSLLRRFGCKVIALFLGSSLGATCSFCSWKQLRQTVRLSLCGTNLEQM